MRILKNKKITIGIIIPLIFLITLTTSVYASEDSTISINPLGRTVSPGDTFTLDVYCVPLQSIKAFEFKVSFDPSLVNVNSVSEGTIFEGHNTFFNPGIIDNNEGKIVDIFDFILGFETVSSPGTFISISFTALSNTGISAINIYDAGVTNDEGYIPISINNGTLTIIDTNFPPEITLINPNNESTDVSVDISCLNISIEDSDGDLFNWNIETNPYIGSSSGQNENNGNKTCFLSDLNYGTLYTCYVNVTDGINCKNETYTFTTSDNQKPIFSGAIPSDNSIDISVETSSLQITIIDPEGDIFNWSITTNPNIGTNFGNNALDGIKTCNITNLSYSTTYSWTISCKDSGSGLWNNQTYSFTTESNNEDNSGGDPSGGGSTGGGSSGGGSSGGGTSYPSSGGQEVYIDVPPETPLKPSGPTFIEMGVDYSYSSYTYDLNGDQIQYKFDWGDGTVSNWSDSTSSNISVSMVHSWNFISSFEITVISKDVNGLMSNWSIPLEVVVSQAATEEIPPVAEIQYSSDKNDDLKIDFDASDSYDLDGVITDYFWDFGDGETGVGINPNHIFKEPGKYSVNLILTDNNGNTFSKTILINVGSSIQDELVEESNLFFFILIGIIGFILSMIILIVIFFRDNISMFFYQHNNHSSHSDRISNNEYKMKKLETRINELKKTQEKINNDNQPDLNIEAYIDKILERYNDSNDNLYFNKK